MRKEGRGKVRREDLFREVPGSGPDKAAGDYESEDILWGSAIGPEGSCKPGVCGRGGGGSPPNGIPPTSMGEPLQKSPLSFRVWKSTLN